MVSTQKIKINKGIFFNVYISIFILKTLHNN